MIPESLTNVRRRGDVHMRLAYRPEELLDVIRTVHSSRGPVWPTWLIIYIPIDFTSSHRQGPR